jgi:NAD-dependent deacetylase
MSRKIVILTGAGISAESGIKTFRDADGLWENEPKSRQPKVFQKRVSRYIFCGIFL